MKKLLFGAAIAGMLISAPAFAQNADQNQTTKSATTTTRSVTKVAPSGERHRVRSSTTVRTDGERHTMRHRAHDRHVSYRVRVGGDRGIHHRSHTRGYAAYGYGCRQITVKKHYHGRTVIKRIRRCV